MSPWWWGVPSQGAPGTWPPAPASSLFCLPLSLSVFLPPPRPHWEVYNEVSHLHSRSNRKRSRPWSSVKLLYTDVVLRIFWFGNRYLDPEGQQLSSWFTTVLCKLLFFIIFSFSIPDLTSRLHQKTTSNLMVKVTKPWWKITEIKVKVLF